MAFLPSGRHRTAVGAFWKQNQNLRREFIADADSADFLAILAANRRSNHRTLRGE
jgi:hypothetical protein